MADHVASFKELWPGKWELRHFSDGLSPAVVWSERDGDPRVPDEMVGWVVRHEVSGAELGAFPGTITLDDDDDQLLLQGAAGAVTAGMEPDEELEGERDLDDGDDEPGPHAEVIRTFLHLDSMLAQLKSTSVWRLGDYTYARPPWERSATAFESLVRSNLGLSPDFPLRVKMVTGSITARAGAQLHLPTVHPLLTDVVGDKKRAALLTHDSSPSFRLPRVIHALPVEMEIDLGTSIPKIADEIRNLRTALQIHTRSQLAQYIPRGVPLACYDRIMIPWQGYLLSLKVLPVDHEGRLVGDDLDTETSSQSSRGHSTTRFPHYSSPNSSSRTAGRVVATALLGKLPGTGGHVFGATCRLFKAWLARPEIPLTGALSSLGAELLCLWAWQTVGDIHLDKRAAPASAFRGFVCVLQALATWHPQKDIVVRGPRAVLHVDGDATDVPFVLPDLVLPALMPVLSMTAARYLRRLNHLTFHRMPIPLSLSQSHAPGLLQGRTFQWLVVLDVSRGGHAHTQARAVVDHLQAALLGKRKSISLQRTLLPGLAVTEEMLAELWRRFGSVAFFSCTESAVAVGFWWSAGEVVPVSRVLTEVVLTLAGAAVSVYPVRSRLSL